METLRAFSLLSLFTWLTVPTYAQGDHCFNATAVSGTGSHVVDTSSYTTSNFNVSGPCSLASPLTGDVFYQWTATTAGNFILDTAGSNFDTQLSLFLGSACSAICIGTDNDGGPGTTSSLGIPGVQTGDTYLIQLGGRLNATGNATLNIREVLDICELPDDGFENNDTCNSGNNMANGTYLDLFASNTDKDIYLFNADAGATVSCSVFFEHALGDVDIFLRGSFGPDCGIGQGPNTLAESISFTNNETLTWTHNGPGFAFLALEVHVKSSTSGPGCNTYDLSIQGSGFLGGMGDRFCDPMTTNSSGTSTMLFASANSSSPVGFKLDGFQGPPGQFGYFLVGTQASDPGLSLGQGRLCLATNTPDMIGRYNVAGSSLNSLGQFNATGTLVNLVGTSHGSNGFLLPMTIPITGGPMIQTGQTWHFQLWHRDTGVSSNFSNGLSLSF